MFMFVGRPMKYAEAITIVHFGQLRVGDSDPHAGRLLFEAAEF